VICEDFVFLLLSYCSYESTEIETVDRFKLYNISEFENTF